MRFLLIISLLICSLFSFAQPGGYTAGTFVNWNYYSRDHGFFKSVGFDGAAANRKRAVVSFEGDNETNSSGLTTQSPGKILNDAGTNWDGKIALSPGDTVYFVVLTIFNTNGNFPPAYTADINYFFANTTNLPDTAVHNYYGISGFSGGCNRMWETLSASGFSYARVFGLTRTISTPFQAGDYTVISGGRRNTVWRNSDDANGGTPVSASDNLFADLSGVKDKKYPTTSLGHSADSALSINGVDSSTNFWRLIAQYSFAGVPNTPPTANAGTDQTVTLPTNSSTISGSASTDADGVITTYAWTKIAGPATYTITSPSSVSTTVTGLIQGVYTFRLTVTDDSSATATDDVVITVSPAQSTTRFYPDRGMAFTRNGRKTYNVERLIDGDTLTKIANTATEESYSAPWEGFIIFKNYMNGLNFDMWQTGGGGSLILTILTDDNDNHIIESNQSLDTGDSLGTYTLNIGGFNVWTHVNLAAYNNVRAIRIQALTNLDKSSQNYEMRFYGDSVGVAPVIFRTPTIVPIPDPGQDIHGMGSLDNANMALMRKVAKKFRIGYLGPIFDSVGYTNTLSMNSPSLVYKLDQNGYDAFNTRVFNDARTYGSKIRVYIIGGTTRNLTAGEAASYDYAIWSKANAFKAIDPGADSVSKASWAGDAKKWYLMAALYGTNTSASLSGLTVHGGNTTTGQGGLTELELGNEESKDWPAMGYPVNVTHSQPSVIYTKMDTCYWKVKQADPNMRVLLPALTYLDTVYVGALFLENWLRYGTSRKAPWDGFGFNVYVNSLYDGQNGDSADVAILPGRWRMIQRLQAFNTMLDKLFPNQSSYDITENSGGASNNIPESPHNVGVVSGKTDLQLMADNTFKMKKHFQIGGKGHMLTHFYYWYGHDGSYVFDFMSMTDQGPGFVDTLRPVGKLLAQMLNTESSYSGWCDKLVDGDSTGNYVAVQYATTGTNKLYSLWKETQAPTSSSITINLGSGVTSATLKSTNYTSENTTNTPLTIIGNSVTVNINETGQYIEATYAASTAPVIRSRKFRRIR